jgi:hypothetical protein
VRGQVPGGLCCIGKARRAPHGGLQLKPAGCRSCRALAPLFWRTRTTSFFRSCGFDIHRQKHSKIVCGISLRHYAIGHDSRSMTSQWPPQCSTKYPSMRALLERAVSTFRSNWLALRAWPSLKVLGGVTPEPASVHRGGMDGVRSEARDAARRLMQGHSKSSRDISVWDVCRAPHSATKKDREHRRGQCQRLLAKLMPSTDRVTDIRRAWSSVDASCRVVSNRDRPHIIPNRAPPLIACGLSYAGQHARGALELSSSRPWPSSGDGYPGCSSLDSAAQCPPICWRETGE